MRLPALLIAALFVTAAKQPLPVPVELRQPLAAVLRISAGLETNKLCTTLDPNAVEAMAQQLKQAAGTMHRQMVGSGITVEKSVEVLTRLSDQGKYLAEFQYATCNELSQEIILKSQRDAECINLYLEGSNTQCFQ